MGLKLWIDDIRPAPEGWHLAKTNTEAIRILDTMEVDEVSIDHDVSHQIMMEGPCGSIVSRPYPCGETFEATARFLALFLRRRAESDYAGPRMNITIHTANPEGGRKIAQILRVRGINLHVALGKPCNRLEGGV